MRALTVAMCAAALLSFAVACEGPQQRQSELAQSAIALSDGATPLKTASPEQKG